MLTKRRFIFTFAGIVVAAVLIWQSTLVAPLNADWQPQLATASTAEFNSNLVTVRNVRNFRFRPTENDVHPGFYDKTYDLTKLIRVWYVTEPFAESRIAAHTFLSFEFSTGDFLAISIEARRKKDQDYSIWRALLRTYPLIYIAADERDVVMLRANVRKDKVYMYPVSLSKKEDAQVLLSNMLKRMNKLVSDSPEWYNTLLSNCTSNIADHVNELSPGRISPFAWQLLLTASADKLALQLGLLDTTLPIEKARERFSINAASERIGDTPTYSTEIRKFEN